MLGKPHTVKIECDLWPTITYSGSDGYKGLSVTVNKNPEDKDKMEKVKTSIKERYKKLEDTPLGYSAKLGDVVVGNMKGFQKNDDGSKGEPLPSVATGDQVEIELQKGKFMDGLIEGLVDCQINDVKSIEVKFPIRPKGPGAALSGRRFLMSCDHPHMQQCLLTQYLFTCPPQGKAPFLKFQC